MALGIIFIGMIPTYPPDMESYLFGNILSVTRLDIIAMAVMTVIIVFITIVLFNDWKTFLFDPEFAKLRGIKPRFRVFIINFNSINSSSFNKSSRNYISNSFTYSTSSNCKIIL